MDIKKALYTDFARNLGKLDNTSKVACIIDDVFAEENELPTDIPFNVIGSGVNQGATEYTLDITQVSTSDKDSITVDEGMLQVYYSTNDVIDTVEEFFDPYVDVSSVEDIYDLYEKLEDLDEYDETDVDEYDEFNPDFEPNDY
jgi:hypothetical protein